MRVAALCKVVSSRFLGGTQAEPRHNPSGMLQGREHLPWEIVGGPGPPPPQPHLKSPPPSPEILAACREPRRPPGMTGCSLLEGKTHTETWRTRSPLAASSGPPTMPRMPSTRAIWMCFTSWPTTFSVSMSQTSPEVTPRSAAASSWRRAVSIPGTLEQRGAQAGAEPYALRAGSPPRQNGPVLGAHFS